MKRKPFIELFAGTASAIMLAAPVFAADLQVVDFSIQQDGENVKVDFTTEGEAGTAPQIFTVSRNNTTITEILNTTLKLGDRQEYTQKNPVPGIKSIQVMQADPESVRIVATGENAAPTGEILQQNSNSIVLHFASGGTAASNSSSSAGTNPTLVAQTDERPSVEYSSPSPSPVPTSENLLRPTAPMPPFLPRASAPPVGDIAVSNIGTTIPNYVNLGTNAVVDGIVLKDTPTQNVLAFLARSAGFNLVYADDIEEKSISLDLENESVEDAFNYVLMLSDLRATLRGQTIFVGTELPGGVSPKITRTFRLNQAEAVAAKEYLESAGTERGDLLPGAIILTDERLNTVTVTGEPKVVEIASNFLTQLDARKRQVAINVKILDVSLQGNRSISSDLKLLLEDRVGISAGDGIIVSPTDLSRSSPFFSEFNPDGITVEQGNQTISFGEQLDSFDSPDPENTLFVGPIAQAYNIAGLPTPAGLNPSQIGAVIQSFDEDGNVQFSVQGLGADVSDSAVARGTNFIGSLVAGLLRQSNSKILADPTLIIQENETANFNLTDKIVVGTTQTVATNADGDVIGTNVEPVLADVGLLLNIEVDTIDDNGFVTLNVQPEISSAPNSVEVDGELVQLKRESRLQSGKVRLRDDQTLILAGAIQEQDLVETSKVPILGDIPIIGSLFRSTTRTNNRRELLFIITPQIIDDSQNSSWGYSYTPSNTAQELLEQERFSPQNDRF